MTYKSGQRLIDHFNCKHENFVLFVTPMKTASTSTSRPASVPSTASGRIPVVTILRSVRDTAIVPFDHLLISDCPVASKAGV